MASLKTATQEEEESNEMNELITSDLSQSIPDSNSKSSNSDPNYSPHSDSKNHRLTPENQTIYFIAYILLYAFHGCLLSLPGAIYVELQDQLSTSTTIISWIYSSMAISAGVFAFISGFVLDRFQSTHRYLALTIFFESAALIAIPFTTNIAMMFVLFVLIGSGFSATDVCGPVFVFRVYPVQGQHKFFITQTVLSIASMAFPSLIQLSINQTNQYYYPLFVAAICGLCFVILALFLPTPRHDELRTIKRKIIKYQRADSKDPESSQMSEIEVARLARQSSSRLDRNKSYKKQQYLILSALIITLLLFAMIFVGANSFITTYVSDYLEMDEAYGRYLISVYWASNLVYRIFNVALQKVSAMKIYPMYAILCGLCVQTAVIGVLWIGFGQNIKVLFVVFALNGFFGSAIFPGLCQWAESVIPVNGLVSCMFIVGYQTGIAIIIPVLGSLIDAHSSKILPYVLLIPAALATFIVVFNSIVYKQCYKKHVRNEITA
eukprot:152086_1